MQLLQLSTKSSSCPAALTLNLQGSVWAHLQLFSKVFNWNFDLFFHFEIIFQLSDRTCFFFRNSSWKTTDPVMPVDLHFHSPYLQPQLFPCPWKLGNLTSQFNPLLNPVSASQALNSWPIYSTSWYQAFLCACLLPDSSTTTTSSSYSSTILNRFFFINYGKTFSLSKLYIWKLD